MGTVPRERSVFFLSYFCRLAVRTASLSLLFGICLALVANPFIATATSPIATARNDAVLVANESTGSATKETIDRPVLAKAAATTHKINNCTKAQMIQPIPVKLRGSGLVEDHEAPQYYEVYGRSAAEVRRQIVRCAPGEYFAYTSSRLSWKYNFIAAQQGCTITNVSVGIRTVVHYPRWSGVQDASATDQLAWQRMADSLILHESGHVQRSSVVAEEMYSALKRMPAISCDTIAAKTQAMVSSYNNKLKQTHIEYDHQTNHGETQGAVL